MYVESKPIIKKELYVRSCNYCKYALALNKKQGYRLPRTFLL